MHSGQSPCENRAPVCSSTKCSTCFQYPWSSRIFLHELQIGSKPLSTSFGGPVSILRRDNRKWVEAPLSHGYAENSRSIGAADMAVAIQTGRDHRCSGELANHVLEIMLAFDKSSKSESFVALKTTCKRPEPLPVGLEPGDVEK